MRRVFWCVFTLVSLLYLQAEERPSPLLPWAEAEEAYLPPGEPGKDYSPTWVPNGVKADYHIVDGIKIFHLIAEPIAWSVAEGLTVNAWGYNGTVPGPLIEVAEGDRVRIYVSNTLAAPTTVHWHGVLLPCGMDGVSGLTQPAIPPGETFVYEFIFPDAGTFMYHSHHDTMTQEGMGLNGMIVVHKREPDRSKRAGRDYAILLGEWSVDVGTATVDPFEGAGFNILTMNGKVMPATEPILAEIGDRVWVRFGNLSAMSHHPIHLHGYSFKVIGTDGGWAEDRAVLLPETTVLVPTGSVRVIEFLANNPGDWIFHCHMTHHIMNQMGHEFPNMLGVDLSRIQPKIEKLIPGYKTLGVTGMHDMTQSGLPIPPNSIPMLGFDGQFGSTVLGGMANVLRVRESIKDNEDPGPYHFPEGSVATMPSEKQLEKDGIELP